MTEATGRRRVSARGERGWRERTHREARRAIRALLPAVFLWQSLAVHAGEWHVDKAVKHNQVRFTSQVAGLSFEGVTDRIDGYVYWEGQKPFEKNTQVLFEVELNTLDTGIGKRDRDMQEVLQTGKWPRAVFKGEITSWTTIDSTVTAYRGTVRGRLSLHGVERAMEAPGTIVVEGDRSKVVSSFTLRLADYGIEAPSLVAFVKVSQEIDIAVSCYLKHVQ